MKIKSFILAAVLLLPFAGARAQTNYDFSGTFANGSTVPDGNLTGWWDTETINNLPVYATLTDVTVSVDLSGGYNGDLYMYLEHDNTLVVLANHPGVGSASPFGYADAGMNVTFGDGGTGDFHEYGSFPGYSLTGGALWQPDGRNISPVSAAAAFDTALRQNDGAPLGLLNDLSSDGDYTLFIADTVPGGGNEQVVNWALTLTSVPEPGVSALLGLGAALSVWRWKRIGAR